MRQAWLLWLLLFCKHLLLTLLEERPFLGLQEATTPSPEPTRWPGTEPLEGGCAGSGFSLIQTATLSVGEGVFWFQKMLRGGMMPAGLLAHCGDTAF